MPVLSPHRSSSSGLSGSYRSTFSSSSLDRPLYGTSSYSPRFSTYTERYTSRSYADADGRRIFCRTGSVTEDGITSRFREESRESSVVRRDSLSRDSGISSIRENSVLEARRDSSASRGSAVSLVESVADIRNKYSPANYVPAVLRNKENIARSKTLNDIGLPPIEVAKLGGKKKVITATTLEPNINTSVREFANNTNSAAAEATDNMSSQEDDNGNRPSVSEMRKKFDKGAGGRATRTSPPADVPAARIADNRFKKLDKPVKTIVNGHAKTTPNKLTNGDVKRPVERNNRKTDGGDSSNVTADRRLKTSKVLDDGAELRGGKEHRVEETTSNRSAAGGKAEKEPTRVNNFASYIPAKDFDKGDVRLDDNNGEMDNSTNTGKTKKIIKDLATSPRLNRSPITQNASNSNSQRNSVEKDSFTRNSVFDDDERRYNNRTSPGKQLGLNGLKNIGNTCFMNSVIQCLSNTKPLLEYVRKDGYPSDINSTLSSMKGALIKAFAQVLKELWSEDSCDRVVNTTALKSQIQRFAPRFMGYSQQDAQEFLRYLLEGLHEDVNRVASKPTPILTEIDEKLSDSDKAAESWQRYLRRENSKVVDIFVGQLKSTLKCTHCGHCSVTFDPFWDLSLPIPQKTGPMRLSQCLESFTREETLDGDEKPTCSKCKERRKCTKSFTIHKFPKILVIHLKRFSPTERFRGKLSVTVDFPLEGLDMSNYAAESHSQCRYNLYAISNHSGTTYSGHYTAYCRHPYSLSWHEYNDSRVSSISSKSIVSGEAYVLFYELDSKLAHL